VGGPDGPGPLQPLEAANARSSVEPRIVVTSADVRERRELMASKTGVRTELYRDQFGVVLDDLDHRMLELKWLEGSASMTDDEFKAWLYRVSGEAERRGGTHFGDKLGAV